MLYQWFIFKTKNISSDNKPLAPSAQPPKTIPTDWDWRRAHAKKTIPVDRSREIGYAFLRFPVLKEGIFFASFSNAVLN